MINYSKTILQKVSSWKSLFQKELIKCYNWLPEEELPELHAWCYASFQQLYPDILDEVFHAPPHNNQRKSHITENRA